MVIWCLQTATCGATVIKVAHPDNSAPTHLHAVESRLSDSTDEVVHPHRTRTSAPLSAPEAQRDGRAGGRVTGNQISAVLVAAARCIASILLLPTALLKQGSAYRLRWESATTVGVGAGEMVTGKQGGLNATAAKWGFPPATRR
jgi:hypothetical protein